MVNFQGHSKNGTTYCQFDTGNEFPRSKLVKKDSFVNVVPIWRRWL